MITVQDLHSKTPEKIKDIREELRKYLINSHLQSLILGLSGGIDSALIAALAFPVCKDLGVKLLGYILPIETNKLEETFRGIGIGLHLTTESIIVNLEDVFRTAQSHREMHFDKIRSGNIKARTRMLFLYDQASENKGCVLSTDNMSEYMLGFWTRYGDEGDICPIQRYYKTEVYEMAKWIVENESLHPMAKLIMQQTIDATPTDGLGITNSDLDQIGAPSYAMVDMILLDPHSDLSKQYPKVMERVRNTEFKRKTPYHFPRLDNDPIMDDELCV